MKSKKSRNRKQPNQYYKLLTHKYTTVNFDLINLKQTLLVLRVIFLRSLRLFLMTVHKYKTIKN